MPSNEIRYMSTINDEVVLDEVVAKNVNFHIEQMDDSCFWFCLSFSDGSQAHFHVVSASGRAKVKLKHSWDNKATPLMNKLDGKYIKERPIQ